MKPSPLRIAVIGAGAHSRDHHLPALARLKRERPDEIVLTAVCDRDGARAAAAAARFGFESALDNPARLLENHQLDAVLVLVPPAAIAAVARPFLERGLPTLIEKPPGASPDETRDIMARAQAAGAPVMVSLNRRFDPALTAARSWLSGRRICAARGAMRRVARREPGFPYETGVHALDAFFFLAGAPDRTETQRVPCGKTAIWLIEIEFETGARGCLELSPACGVMAERFEFMGEGWSLEARAAGQDDGRLRCWESGVLTRHESFAEGEPPFVRSGAWAETVSFIEAIRGRRPFHPTPADVLPALDALYPLVL